MGTYLNPGKDAFEEAISSDIFIDKTEMIHYLNSVARTEQKYVCVSRPRRFGKSIAANMICAYYGREANSRALFEKCKISKVKGDDNASKWDEYLGKFNVIRLVMTDFMEDSESVNDMLDYLSEEVIAELQDAYPNVNYGNRVNLRTVMNKIYGSTKEQFVIVIDEWDAVLRKYKEDKEGQEKYLDFLRNWLKDKVYVALAYMTGILPIKKFGKHSDLNMFDEYSMTNQMQFAPYAGFTEDEVEGLCKRYGRDFKQIKDWYDGYRLSNKLSKEILAEDAVIDTKVYREYEVYSPYSVVEAIRTGDVNYYWNQTDT